MYVVGQVNMRQSGQRILVVILAEERGKGREDECIKRTFWGSKPARLMAFQMAQMDKQFGVEFRDLS